MKSLFKKQWLDRFLTWYKDKFYTDINFYFSDNEAFHVIEVYSFQEEDSLAEPSINFGAFEWKPEMAIAKPLKFKTDVEKVISYIERRFEEETGYTLWTEVDILNQIRRVLQKGKNGIVNIPWGVFKRYRLVIKFSQEA